MDEAAAGGSELTPRTSLDMGNDITPPDGGVTRLDVDEPRARGGIRRSLRPRGRTPAGTPSFVDVTRFRDVSPMDAARSYGARALELADQARWEAGVARQALHRRDLDFAREALQLAQQHATAATCLRDLMSSALDESAIERQVTLPSTASWSPLDSFLRVEREVGVAAALVAGVRGDLDQVSRQRGTRE